MLASPRPKVKAESHPIRGKVEALSTEQISELADGLCKYVRAHFDDGRGDDLWAFGVYSGNLDESGKPFTEKNAPHIMDLVRNQKLWEMFLSVMPSAKMKDRDVAVAVRKMLADELRGNNQGVPMALFVTWFLRAWSGAASCEASGEE